MALSAFPQDAICIPPSDFVSLAYNSSSPNGLDVSTNTAVYSTDGTIGINNILTQPVECGGGIDVVFLVDYTSSMGGAISGVKAGISNILSTISAESNGNYRLGLCIFDEEVGNLTTPNYGSNTLYTSLPSSQKVAINVGGFNRTQFITCLEPLGNIGSTSAFQSQLNALATSFLPLGDGVGIPEPGGLGVNEIVSNGIAGSFRSDAIKIIVLITDAVPGGYDDVSYSQDQTYFNNTLIGVCDSLDVQVMVQSSKSANEARNYYVNLANGTTPTGRYDQVTFDGAGNWINTGLISGIESLCENSFTGTCTEAASGWYYNSGDYSAYYFDNTSGKFTSQYYFPAEYNVSPSTTLTDENGRTITWTITTKYVGNGTVLYWDFNSGSNVTSSDFINAISNGSFTINNDTGSFQLTTRADSLTEGTESIGVRIRTGSVNGSVVATSDFTLISDTSQNVPTPTPVPISYYQHYSVQADGSGNIRSDSNCSEFTTISFWSERGSVLGLQVGDSIYANSTGTTLWNGNGYYYQVGDTAFSTVQKVIRIGEGQVLSITNCPVVQPTPTPTIPPTYAPPTPTPTDVSSGGGAGSATCRNVWVRSTVNTTRYGLQWRNSLGNTVSTRFNQMLATPMWYGGVEGAVYSVCSTLVPGVWDFNTAALVSLSGGQVVNFADGGVCTSDSDCVYIAPTATPMPTYEYVVECVSGDCLQGTGRVVSSTTQYSIGQIVTLNNQNGCWEVMPEVSSATPVSTVTGICAPTPTPTTSIYKYVMDPCDGVSSYVVAQSNTPKSIGTVYSLSGSSYADQNYTCIQTTTASAETTILSVATCDGVDPNCLLAGTLITLADGTQKAIENIAIGDELKSTVVGDMPDGDNTEVLALWSQANPTISNTTTTVQNNKMSTVDSVLSFNNGRLTSSKDHLHVIKRSGNWMVVIASSVVVGDVFVTQSGSEVVITLIEELTGTFNVYKLDVETNDTYIASDIITHNAKLGPR